MGARHVLAVDLPAVTTGLARAFHDDPQFRFLFAGSEGFDAGIAGFMAVAAEASLRRGHAYTLDGASGAALWVPPDVEFLGEREFEALVPVFAAAGDDCVGRAAALGEAMAAHHPHRPHFYLAIVGVDPSRQGQRLGEALLAPVLARCDADGLPAYLESSNPRNVSFYLRQGFTVTAEFGAEGGPIFTGMWREPVRR